MKILTAEQTREADAFTIKNEPISSTDLMERAAQTCTDWITKKYDNKTVFTIFCGVGNNGGDGLVIARQLIEKAYQVDVLVVEFSAKHSANFEVNLERLQKVGLNPVFLSKDMHDVYINKDVVVIDAIFGSGLSKPITGWVADFIHEINAEETTKIAIDVPSGLFTEDNSENIDKNIIKADVTLTFQQPKLAFLMPQNFTYVGEFVVLAIGLHQEFLHQVKSKQVFITKPLVQSIFHTRQKFEHKGNFGHALIIAGSKGKMGAEILASKACLRSGAGLLTVQVPKCGVAIMQTALPEAMCIADDEDKFISTLTEIGNFASIGIGPGLGQEQQTQKVLKLLIQNADKPLVIDADALNILSENKTWLAFLPPNSILTPHPKEFERLVGKWATDEERLTLLQEFAYKNKLIVVLKGAHTAIACPDEMVFFNSTGNPGMATGGSGDVLTGIITGLLAQGYAPKDAAILGVYLHGLAGDIAKENLGEESMIAGDIINYLPMAFGWLKG